MFQARDHSTRDTLLWDDNDGGPEKIIMKQCFLPFILNSTHAGAQTFREIRTKASWIFVRVGVLILCGSYHKSQTRWLTTTEIYSLRVLEAEVLKSGCPQGHIVPKGSRGKSSFWLFQLLETSGASLVAQMVKICPQYRRPEFDSWVRKIPWRSEWLPTPVLLPREFHVQRSLAGYSLWSHKDSDTTEQHTHTHTHTHTHSTSGSLQHSLACGCITPSLPPPSYGILILSGLFLLCILSYRDTSPWI